MNILGIETSCDETAAAVVADGRQILSSVVATSLPLHAKTGGIIPEKAAREQLKSILPVIEEALSQAKLKKETLEALAVTTGPGLIGSLLVGVETAKVVSLLWDKETIPVNHLVAHIYANWLSPLTEPAFPALALVVSGGHTDLVLIRAHGKIKWVGGTRDDAAGEAFDKSARILGLPYPGGPSISYEAEKYLLENPKDKLDLFPRPMINDRGFDWSFSGLKTAVLRYSSGIKRENLVPKIPKLAANVQEAIAEVLVAKTLLAVDIFKPKSLLLAGGVAANKRLSEKFRSEIARLKMNVDFRVPPPGLCTDNAAYIASFAFYNNTPLAWERIKANPELSITGQV